MRHFRDYSPDAARRLAGHYLELAWWAACRGRINDVVLWCGKAASLLVWGHA